MPIPIYKPHITHAPIYYPRNGARPYLRYNHCVDVIPFRDFFLAAWNANATPKEGVPGQYNYCSLSHDFRSWTPHERLFRVESDNQWQPSFINYRDRKLFVMWCDFNAEKSYVMESEDGREWKNCEIPAPPAEMAGTVAFPTNHGLLTRDGVMVFPVSFPPAEGPGGVGCCRYAGALLSRDGGESWEWGGVTEAGEENLYLWEPMIFEKTDGSWGMLIRNAGSPGERTAPPAEQTLLFAESCDGGGSWTKCVTLDLESVVSRCYAAAFDRSLLMVMNDWQPGIRPERSPDDRLMLSLYFAPLTDPELLMPAVLIQPPGGRAFYPNGFLKEGKLYCAYSYPDYIMGTVVHELPDFSADFLAVRGGREGAELVPAENRLTLSRPQGTVPLFLSCYHAEQETVTLSFRFRSRFRSEGDFPLLTLGGKSARGGVLLLRFLDGVRDELLFRNAAGTELHIGSVRQGEKNAVAIRFDAEGIAFGFSGREFRMPGQFLHKIAFGGLYERPVWPPGTEPVRDEIEIEYDSIEVK